MDYQAKHKNGRSGIVAPARSRVLLPALLATLTILAWTIPQDTQADQGDAPISWSRPVVIDDLPPFSTPVTLNDVSCVASSLCVAVDADGNILSSVDPADGSTAHWVFKRVARAEINGVFCASDSLCAAVDAAGRVFTSTDPTLGARATWAVTHVHGAEELNNVWCGGSRCVAVGNAGVLLISDDPGSRSPAKWKLMHIDHGEGLSGISCAHTLCVATDATGHVVSTANAPTASAKQWRPDAISADNISPELRAVSCATPTLCVAIDGNTFVNAYSSAEAAGGSLATWVITELPSINDAYDISCTPSLCAVVGAYGAVAITSDPFDGISARWTTETIDKDRELLGVSCTSTSLCVAVDRNGGIATNVTAGRGSWAVEEVDGTDRLDAVSCATSSFCAVATTKGAVLTSTDLSRGAKAKWQINQAGGPRGITAMSCITALCVAINRTGRAISSADPRDGAGATWAVRDIDKDTELEDISCPSPTLCVAVDWAGNALSTSDPGAGATATWNTKTIDAGHVLAQISCPSAQLCLATDTEGNVLVSTDPARGAAARWSRRHPGIAEPSCPSTRVCLARESFLGGNILTSSDPAAPRARWDLSLRSRFYSEAPSQGLISCGSVSFCAAVVGGEQLATTTNADARSHARWSIKSVDPTGTLTGVSCAPALCVAIDSLGHVAVARH